MPDVLDFVLRSTVPQNPQSAGLCCDVIFLQHRAVCAAHRRNLAAAAFQSLQIPNRISSGPIPMVVETVSQAVPMLLLMPPRPDSPPLSPPSPPSTSITIEELESKHDSPERPQTSAKNTLDQKQNTVCLSSYADHRLKRDSTSTSSPPNGSEGYGSTALRSRISPKNCQSLWAWLLSLSSSRLSFRFLCCLRDIPALVCCLPVDWMCCAGR